MRTWAVGLLMSVVINGPVLAQAVASPANPEMAQIFSADQADCAAGLAIDWAKVGARDKERQTATRKLLAEGALKTGTDFRAAAFVFQHGDSPDDYLLAHTLALVAVAKGERDAMWIATATLDRYLIAIQQPQIYGTQYSRDRATRAWTQEPYQRDLVSDALRAELGVKTSAEQVAHLARLQTQPTPRTSP